MDISALIKKIGHERKFWRHERSGSDEAGYKSGVMYGLFLAMAIIKAEHKAYKAKHPKIENWSPFLLRRACEAAHHSMKLANHKRARREIEAVLEKLKIQK